MQPQAQSFSINQLTHKAQLKANTTLSHIINAHRKSHLGINMPQFELAAKRDIKFDRKGNVLEV